MHQDLHNSLRVRARSTAVEQRHSAAAAEPVTVRIEPRDFHSGEGERATAPAHHCARGITSARWTLRRRRQVGARRGCPPRGPANPSRARPRKATWQSSPHRTVSVLDPAMEKSAILGILIMLTSWASWRQSQRSAALSCWQKTKAKPSPGIAVTYVRFVAGGRGETRGGGRSGRRPTASVIRRFTVVSSRLRRRGVPARRASVRARKAP